MPKPNHICKYSGCTAGKDGGPRHYYACNWCDRTGSWRSVACCPEHYTMYKQEVVAARAAATLPHRTDISPQMQAELMERPEHEVLEESLQELSGYADIIEREGISAAVEYINRGESG